MYNMHKPLYQNLLTDMGIELVAWTQTTTKGEAGLLQWPKVYLCEYDSYQHKFQQL